MLPRPQRRHHHLGRQLPERVESRLQAEQRPHGVAVSVALAHRVAEDATEEPERASPGPTSAADNGPAPLLGFYVGGALAGDDIAKKRSDVCMRRRRSTSCSCGDGPTERPSMIRRRACNSQKSRSWEQRAKIVRAAFRVSSVSAMIGTLLGAPPDRMRRIGVLPQHARKEGSEFGERPMTFNATPARRSGTQSPGRSIDV